MYNHNKNSKPILILKINLISYSLKIQSYMSFNEKLKSIEH